MIKMLIVDDEVTTRKGLMEYISWGEIGVDAVYDAEDGQKGLELASAIHPDIVLTDVRMPRMNGIELAQRLKDMLPLCKVVFLSGYSDKEYLLSAINLQAVNYIEKPVDLEEVRRVIQKTVALCIEDRQRLDQTRENLCLDIIRHKDAPDKIRSRLRKMHINLPVEAPVTCIVFKLNPASDNDPPISTLLKGTLFEALEKRISSISSRYLYALKERNLIVLLTFENILKDMTGLMEMLEALKEDIAAAIPNQKGTSVGIGKCVSLDNAMTSYQTAFLAVQKEFFMGYGHIHIHRDNPDAEYDLGSVNLQAFTSYIQEGSENSAVFFIKSTANELKHHSNTLINNIRNLFFTILNRLSELAEDRGIQLKDSDNSEFFWEVISRLSTIDEIEAYVLEKLGLYFRICAEKESQNAIVFNIKNYIRSHYGDMDLSIKTLSQHTFLTPNYLCLLFKKETGKTLNQYITEVRIEKAKELLRNRQVKLYAVSTSVGFSDANYFAKIFKKLEGINPSEYREKFS